MDIQRICRHFAMTQGRVNRAFPRSSLSAIEQAIKASEATHVGEVRFVVEGALDGTPLYGGQTAKERALDVFSKLRMWDTEYNTGVLIYLLLADRHVEIIADRGIHAKTGAHAWSAVCRDMETDFKAAKYEEGAVRGIQAVTHHLAQHFPAQAGTRNELPDRPVLL